MPGACAAADLSPTGEKARETGLRVLVHACVILVWVAVVWAPALAVAAAETEGWRGMSLLALNLAELPPPVRGDAALCETRACSVLRRLNRARTSLRLVLAVLDCSTPQHRLA